MWVYSQSRGGPEIEESCEETRIELRPELCQISMTFAGQLLQHMHIHRKKKQSGTDIFNECEEWANISIEHGYNTSSSVQKCSNQICF